MIVPRRVIRRIAFAPLVAAPLGLMFCGCDRANESAPSVMTATDAARPRLFTPEPRVQQISAAATSGATSNQAETVVYRPASVDERVYRLPATNAHTPHVAQRLPTLPSKLASPELRFPALPANEPRTASRAPVKLPALQTSEELAPIELPSALLLSKDHAVRPLPALPKELGEQLPKLAAPITSQASQPAEGPQLGSIVKPAPQPEMARPAVSPAMRAVVERTARQVQGGFALANRGAVFSARSEFIGALRSLSQALDAQAGGEVHAQALAAGLRALEESDDFVPRGTQLETELELATILPAHQTPVLKDENVEEVSLLQARSRYYTYAQEQLALAAGQERVGSMALFGLAKVQTALVTQGNVDDGVAGPKAVALQQAALMVDGGNYLAANELGVLLARYGQYAQARDVLQHAVRLAPQPTAWRNLAIVHQRLGEAQLAAQADQHAQALNQRPEVTAKLANSASPVVWTDAQTFARASKTDQGQAVGASGPAATNGKPAAVQSPDPAPKSAWKLWGGTTAR